jgi:hypothetical protein
MNMGRVSTMVAKAFSKKYFALGISSTSTCPTNAVVITAPNVL